MKSEQSHQGGGDCRDRASVRAKRALGNQVRGVLRPFGIHLRHGKEAKKFSTAAPSGSATRCNAQCKREARVESTGAIEAQIARLDQQLKELARRSQKFVGGSNRSRTSRLEWPSTDRVLLSYRSATTVSVNRLGSRRNNSLADTVAMPDHRAVQVGSNL